MKKSIVAIMVMVIILLISYYMGIYVAHSMGWSTSDIPLLIMVLHTFLGGMTCIGIVFIIAALYHMYEEVLEILN